MENNPKSKNLDRDLEIYKFVSGSVSLFSFPVSVATYFISRTAGLENVASNPKIILGGLVASIVGAFINQEFVDKAYEQRERQRKPKPVGQRPYRFTNFWNLHAE